MNLADRWAWWQVFLVPEYRTRPRFGEWAVLFTRYLFEQFPIRKLCSEVFAFNDTVIKLHEKLGFHLDGRIRDHTWYRDRYWDHVFYSMTREKWGEAMQRYGFIAEVEGRSAGAVIRDATRALRG